MSNLNSDRCLNSSTAQYFLQSPATLRGTSCTSCTATRSCRNRRSLFTCLIWACLLVWFSGPIAQTSIAQEPADQATSVVEKVLTVSLQIDFGDGFAKSYGPFPWREELSITDLMQHASQHKHPTKFATRGKGTTAFLTGIDGIENEGYGKKCWIFYVNGKKGEASFATVQLSASDSVLWKYQTFP